MASESEEPLSGSFLALQSTPKKARPEMGVKQGSFAVAASVTPMRMERKVLAEVPEFIQAPARFSTWLLPPHIYRPGVGLHGIKIAPEPMGGKERRIPKSTTMTTATLSTRCEPYESPLGRGSPLVVWRSPVTGPSTVRMKIARNATTAFSTAIPEDCPLPPDIPCRITSTTTEDDLSLRPSSSRQPISKQISGEFRPFSPIHATLKEFPSWNNLVSQGSNMQVDMICTQPGDPESPLPPTSPGAPSVDLTAGSLPWNLGVLPETWVPEEGDNGGPTTGSHLEVVEVGLDRLVLGEAYAVRPIGAFLVIGADLRLTWVIVVLRAECSMARRVICMEDLDWLRPDLTAGIAAWLKEHPFGSEVIANSGAKNQIGLKGKPSAASTARSIVRESHLVWCTKRPDLTQGIQKKEGCVEKGGKELSLARTGSCKSTVEDVTATWKRGLGPRIQTWGHGSGQPFNMLLLNSLTKQMPGFSDPEPASGASTPVRVAKGVPVTPRVMKLIQEMSADPLDLGGNEGVSISFVPGSPLPMVLACKAAEKAKGREGKGQLVSAIGKVEENEVGASPAGKGKKEKKGWMVLPFSVFVKKGSRQTPNKKENKGALQAEMPAESAGGLALVAMSPQRALAPKVYSVPTAVSLMVMASSVPGELEVDPTAEVSGAAVSQKEREEQPEVEVDKEFDAEKDVHVDGREETGAQEETGDGKPANGAKASPNSAEAVSAQRGPPDGPEEEEGSSPLPQEEGGALVLAVETEDLDTVAPSQRYSSRVLSPMAEIQEAVRLTAMWQMGKLHSDRGIVAPRLFSPSSHKGKKSLRLSKEAARKQQTAQGEEQGSPLQIEASPDVATAADFSIPKSKTGELQQQQEKHEDGVAFTCGPLSPLRGMPDFLSSSVGSAHKGRRALEWRKRRGGKEGDEVGDHSGLLLMLEDGEEGEDVEAKEIERRLERAATREKQEAEGKGVEEDEEELGKDLGMLLQSLDLEQCLSGLGKGGQNEEGIPLELEENEGEETRDETEDMETEEESVEEEEEVEDSSVPDSSVLDTEGECSGDDESVVSKEETGAEVVPVLFSEGEQEEADKGKNAGTKGEMLEPVKVHQDSSGLGEEEGKEDLLPLEQDFTLTFSNASLDMEEEATETVPLFHARTSVVEVAQQEEAAVIPPGMAKEKDYPLTFTTNPSLEVEEEEDMGTVALMSVVPEEVEMGHQEEVALSIPGIPAEQGTDEATPLSESVDGTEDEVQRMLQEFEHQMKQLKRQQEELSKKHKQLLPLVQRGENQKEEGRVQEGAEKSENKKKVSVRSSKKGQRKESERAKEQTHGSTPAFPFPWASPYGAVPPYNMTRPGIPQMLHQPGSDGLPFPPYPFIPSPYAPHPMHQSSSRPGTPRSNSGKSGRGGEHGLYKGEMSSLQPGYIPYRLPPTAFMSLYGAHPFHYPPYWAGPSTGPVSPGGTHGTPRPWHPALSSGKKGSYASSVGTAGSVPGSPRTGSECGSQKGQEFGGAPWGATPGFGAPPGFGSPRSPQVQSPWGLQAMAWGGSPVVGATREAHPGAGTPVPPNPFLVPGAWEGTPEQLTESMEKQEKDNMAFQELTRYWEKQEELAKLRASWDSPLKGGLPAASSGVTPSPTSGKM